MGYDNTLTGEEKKYKSHARESIKSIKMYMAVLES